MATLYYESSFAHHGTIGQKWGIRRYQNKDGSLTDLGYARLKSKTEWRPQAEAVFRSKRVQKAYNKYYNSAEAIRQFNGVSEDEFRKLAAKASLKDSSTAYKDEASYKRAYEKTLASYNKSNLSNSDLLVKKKINSNSVFNEYLRSRKIDPEKFSDQYNDAAIHFKKECDQITSNIVGKYGKSSLGDLGITFNGKQYGSTPITVESLVSDMAQDFANIKFTNTRSYVDNPYWVKKR